MKQSGHLNHSEETGTGCPVTSKYGWTPPNKHVGRQQPYGGNVLEYGSCYGFVCCEYRFFLFHPVVDVSALSICIVLRVFVLVIYACFCSL